MSFCTHLLNQRMQKYFSDEKEKSGRINNKRTCESWR